MRTGTFIILWLFLAIQFQAFSQNHNELQTDPRMAWWRDARFGMFIHWGLYAVPAGEWNGKTGYGEWIRSSAEIPLETYDQFVPQFNPVRFDADEWVKMAKEAGMKYIVITSKHHDGFCMYGTQQTDFCILATPWKKDPMKELAEACKKHGLKFCFYYSIMDWHHPDYLPRRIWETDRSSEGADFDRYVAYMKAELKELLTGYGEIGVLWFDGEWETTWNEKYGKEIYAYCRSLQPGIIINNRVGAGRLDMEGLTKEGAFGGDFGTPEQQIPPTGLPGVDWETCMTMNDHWGYNRADKNFKSTAEILRMLADIASKGGNYLLNVGPKADGEFPKESVERLKEIGKWMSVNGEAIYGTTASPFAQTPWGRCTRKDHDGGVKLYLHVFQWPANREITVPGCLNTVKEAYLLADRKHKPLETKRAEDAIVIRVPEKMPDTVNTVIVLDLIGKLDLTNPPVIRSDFDILTDSMTVGLLTDRENVEIRYTLDGSEPTLNSVLYVSPFAVRQSLVVSAKCFREGKPVSGTAKKSFTKISPVSGFGNIAFPEMKDEKDTLRLPGVEAGFTKGYRYMYYEGSWDSIPDFRRLKPVKSGKTGTPDLELRNREEEFGFVFEALLSVPSRDVYAFYTESDDGSKLYIDDRLVVNNDGLHARISKEGVIALGAGLHKIRVEYFERSGGNELYVLWRKNNGKKEPLTSVLIYD